MKKLLSILLSALMVLSLVPVGLFVFTAAANEGTTDWATVDGTYEGELFINTADDWAAFLGKSGDFAKASVWLCKDIDVSAKTGVGPIADFKGTFEGQGFTVTGLKTGLFTTLSGALNDVTLDVKYANAATAAGYLGINADLIGTLAAEGEMNNVTFTGLLSANQRGSSTADSGNVFINNVNGKISGLTITNVQGFTGSEASRYLFNINNGAVIDGLTINGGSQANIHAAIGSVNTGALIKNLTTANNFNRMLIFKLNGGTIDGLVLDSCEEIIFRKVNEKDGSVVKNVVLKNMVASGFTLFFPTDVTKTVLIDGLTVDNTTTVSLSRYSTTDYLPASVTIKNMVVNNGATVYLPDVRGTVDGLTVNGSTSPVIGKVTGTVKNVVTNGIGAPVIVGEAIEIATADDWKDFLSNKTYTYEGVTVKLMNTIDASSVTGVGPLTDFKGTFDGQGFAVNNIKTGVFTTMSGTVKDTTFNVSYHGLTANLMGTMSGTLSGVTFTGTLHNRDGEATNASNTNLFINEVTGTINGLTIHDALSYTGGNGNYIAYIKGTARVSNLTISGSSGLVQYMIRVVESGAVINNFVLDGTVRSAINTFNSGAVINGLTCKNHTNIIFLNLNGTVNDLVIDGGNAGTELFYRSVTNHAGTINNLTVKNLANIVINQTDASYAVKAWPANLKLTGKLVVNNSVFPFGNLISKPISGKLFAGYMDAQGNVVEDITTYEGDATVKFVDPAMVAVVAQGKKQNDGKYTLRFLTTVDRLDGYKNVKISITRDGKEGAYGKEMTTVYSSVLADGVSIDAATVTGVADSKYIVTYEIRNIPAEAANVMFSATATVTMADGSTITSTTGGACNCTVAGTVPGYTA